MTFTIKPAGGTLLNLKGWKIVRNDGAVLFGFVQRREAERLLLFFAPADLEENQ